MAVIHGGKTIVYLGGVAIAGAKSCEVRTSCDVIEKASSTQANAKEYIPGRTSWKVTCSFLVVGNSAKTYLQKKGTVVTLLIETDGVNDSTMSGQAIVTGASFSAPKGSLSSGSIEFLGTGELSNSAPNT